MSKSITYNNNDRAIVDALKDSKGLTLAEINEITGLNLVSSHLVSAMRKGLIAVTGERKVERPVIRSVNAYIYNTDEVLVDGVGLPYNYTKGEKEVLAAAKDIRGRFCLDDLALLMGLDTLSSGRINGLVRKGNIIKDGTIEMEDYSTYTVKVYSFVKDIPDNA